MIEIREYIDHKGRSFYGKWFDDLDPTAAAKIAVALARLEQGNVTNVKSVGAGVLECRIDFGPGYRIYFGRHGERFVILLGGGTKKRQPNDIRKAQALWQEYKRRRQEL